MNSLALPEEWTHCINKLRGSTRVHIERLLAASTRDDIIPPQFHSKKALDAFEAQLKEAVFNSYHVVLDLSQDEVARVMALPTERQEVLWKALMEAGDGYIVSASGTERWKSVLMYGEGWTVFHRLLELEELREQMRNESLSYPVSPTKLWKRMNKDNPAWAKELGPQWYYSHRFDAPALRELLECMRTYKAKKLTMSEDMLHNFTRLPDRALSRLSWWYMERHPELHGKVVKWAELVFTSRDDRRDFCARLSLEHWRCDVGLAIRSAPEYILTNMTAELRAAMPSFQQTPTLVIVEDELNFNASVNLMELLKGRVLPPSYIANTLERLPEKGANRLRGWLMTHPHVAKFYHMQKLESLRFESDVQLHTFYVRVKLEQLRCTIDDWQAAHWHDGSTHRMWPDIVRAFPDVLKDASSWTPDWYVTQELSVPQLTALLDVLSCATMSVYHRSLALLAKWPTFPLKVRSLITEDRCHDPSGTTEAATRGFLGNPLPSVLTAEQMTHYEAAADGVPLDSFITLLASREITHEHAHVLSVLLNMDKALTMLSATDYGLLLEAYFKEGCEAREKAKKFLSLIPEIKK